MKIRLPIFAIKYLRTGDSIDATFLRAIDGNYCYVHMFTFVHSFELSVTESDYLCSGLEAGTEKQEENALVWTRIKLNKANVGAGDSAGLLVNIDAEQARELRAVKEYQDRKMEQLNAGPPPKDMLFPEDMFTEEWFTSKENDICSDDEDFGGIYTYGEDSDNLEGSEDDGDDHMIKLL